MKIPFPILLLCLLPLGALSQKNASYAPKVLIPFNENGKWGYSDTLGNLKCLPQFDSVSFFQVWQDSFALASIGGKFGIINHHFRFVVAPKYAHLKGPNCCPRSHLNLLEVGNGKKWGIDDIDGKRILPIKYEGFDLNYLSFGFIMAKKKGKYGVFDLEGKKLSDFIFTNFAPGIFGGGALKDMMGKSEKGYFLIKDSDHSIVPAPRTPNPIAVKMVNPNTPGSNELSPDDKALYEKKAANIKAAYGLDHVYLDKPLARAGNHGNLLYVKVDKQGKVGIWDVKNDVVNFIEYEDIVALKTYNKSIAKQYGFSQLWYVAKNGKWGVVTDKAVVRVPFEYDGFGKITDNFAETIQAGKSGAVIHFTYYPPIPCKYDGIDFLQQLEVSPFWAFGVYKIKKNGQIGYIGENGVEFFKFE